MKDDKRDQGQASALASAAAAPGRILGSLREALHAASRDDRSGAWLSSSLGHRAIGVVYQPQREAGNYVPTRMGGRYDALMWFEQSSALHPLHHEPRPREPEYETEPTGF